MQVPMLDITAHEAWFADYVARERRLEKEDPSPMDLKREHTEHVLANARAIAEEEDFSPLVHRACLLAALYHDIARFEQYLRYRTFRDRVSVDHGRLGVRLIKETGCLRGESRELQHLIMAAVGLHNRYALPAKLGQEVALVTHVVRDADKLDILRVIDGHLAKRPYNPTVVLQLPDDPTLSSSKVIACALQKSTASYADLLSVNDFRLLLATWMFDLHFATSRQRFIKQGHARNILLPLPEHGVYAQARAQMLALLA
ncbi:MAG: HD domain-containing protein [Desulfovibrio sp.]|nr:HD domain-containing protein [Desulfovibrio sp.]